MDALKHMGNFKALGPYGFYACSYKEAWPIVKEQVLLFFAHLHEHDAFCPTLNHTNIAFIPKTARPTKPKHFRPINLTNVIYRLLIKVLVNRVRPIIQKFVSLNQYAVLPKRSIHESALLAQEVFHRLNQNPHKKLFSIKI